MRKLFLLLVSVLACYYAGFTIPPVSKSSAYSYLEDRGEVYFSFPVPESAVLDLLLQVVSFETIKDDRVFAYANSSEFDAFLQYTIDYLVHIPPSLQMEEKSYNMRSSVNISDISTWDFYPTYDAYESMMKQYADTFPELCSLVNIKTLESGRKLLFLKISADNDTGHARPRFMYTSTIHGDEPPGFNLMLRLIHYLLTGYGQDDRITYLMNSLEIWICPNENPDGTYTHDNSSVLGGTRSNSNGIDMNRNYPALINSNPTPVQPEVQAMINLVDSISFVMSANIHTGAECVNYPFDQWISPVRKHADHYWWQMVSHEYADSARHYSRDGYMNPFGSNFVNGVTHGGDWYVVTGGRQDYMNYFARQRELTLELFNTKSPATSVLPDLWDYNYRSIINYMYQAIYGIHGVVKDGANNTYLTASIELPAHDDDVSGVIASLPGGNFYRPLLEGAYDLKIESEGYLPQYLFGIEAYNHEVLFLEIDMGRLTFDPVNVVFEPTVAGGITSQIILITNTGAEDLTITLDGFTGDPVFSYNVAAKTDMNIPSGGQESLELWFGPTNAGIFSGALAFTMNLPHQPQVFLPLSGNVLSEAALLYSTNPVMDFGIVNLSQSYAMNLLLRNTGNRVLAISDIHITNDAFVAELSIPYNLDAGDSVHIPVVFSPEFAQTYTATLNFESNATNNQYAISLLGQGSDNTMVNESEKNSDGVSLFPNPIEDTSFLEWFAASPGPVVIQLYDGTGNRLFSEDYGFLESGTHRFPLGMLTKQLPVGMYILQIQSKNTTRTIKLVKIHL